MKSRSMPLYAALFLVFMLLLQPGMVRAQSNDEIVVNSRLRMQGMVDLYEAFNSHGSFAGPYALSDEPVQYKGESQAPAVARLISSLDWLGAQFNGHVGFFLSEGDYVLLVGANGPINKRDPFTVGPAGVWLEISGVFYDPRSDDFAIRLQSSYIGRGQHPRSGDDVNAPIPGGALYVEASWDQLNQFISTAKFKITAAVYEAYGPNKHINMDVGGRAFARHVQNVQDIDAYDALEIREPFHNPEYVPWDALVSGQVAPNTIGAGVCGFFAPGMNSVFRLMLATGTPFTFVGIGHDVGHKYNPTTNDPSAWFQYYGRYIVVDSTTMDPGPDFLFHADKAFTFSYTALIYHPGRWENMFYVTEAHLEQ